MRDASRGRRCAQCWDRTLRPIEPDERPAMVVPVQHEFGASFRKHFAKFVGVGEAPQVAARRARGRMMDENDPKEPARAIECRGKTRELVLAEPPGRQEWPRRNGGGKRDQRHAAAPADERKRAG